MNEQEILQILGRVGAVIKDSHIVYTSRKHGSAYVNKDALYPHTQETSELCMEIARPFFVREAPVDVVVAPAVGGCILSTRVAEHLTKLQGYEVLGIYADKEGDGFVIKRGYDKFVPRRNVLVVEDVLTTGGSARKVVEAIRALDGAVRGVGVLCNRGGVTKEQLGHVPRLISLLNITMDAWDEKDCPLCRDGIPVNTDVGKGREFLARK